MRICLLLLFSCTLFTFAQGPRLIEHEVPVAQLTSMELRANVGDVQIQVVEGPVIRIKVTLTAHRRGMFGNAEKMARTLVEARLFDRMDNRARLSPEIDPDNLR